jgi:hypothetical protein
MFPRNFGNHGPDGRVSKPKRPEYVTAIRTSNLIHFCVLFFPSLKRKTSLTMRDLRLAESKGSCLLECDAE